MKFGVASEWPHPVSAEFGPHLAEYVSIVSIAYYQSHISPFLTAIFIVLHGLHSAAALQHFTAFASLKTD